MNAWVAVIVPVRQAAGTIDAALASVAGQTVLPSEIVVVDDGSTDGTAEVARRWEHLLPLTVVRHEERQGPAAARRTAVDASRSRLLTLLEVGDVWLPNHLAALLASYGEESDIVTADAYRWVPNKGLLRATYRDRQPVPAPSRQARIISRRNFVFPDSLFSRERYEGVGGFRSQADHEVDWDLWIRMIHSGSTVRTTDQVTVLSRLGKRAGAGRSERRTEGRAGRRPKVDAEPGRPRREHVR